MPPYNERLPPLQVLYEDNHLIAVFKPAGLLVQGDISGEPCLMDFTKEWLKEKYGKPGNVFLGLLHRLDRPVAGIVLFGKTSKGASRLSEQFRTRKVRKLYAAIVEGRPKPADQILESELEGKPARLRYRTVEKRGAETLVEIELETGRKHQIRIQLSGIGHPIVGDSKYGARSRWLSGGIALVALRLEFSHPVREAERVIVELPAVLSPLGKGGVK